LNGSEIVSLLFIVVAVEKGAGIVVKSEPNFCSWGSAWWVVKNSAIRTVVWLRHWPQAAEYSSPFQATDCLQSCGGPGM
jgi:hypothetical protein